MARVEQDFAGLITLSEYAAQAERYQEIVTEKSTEQVMMHGKMLRKKRCQQKIYTQIKNFQFLQHQISYNCKAKKKGNLKMEMSEYKIDADSIGNLIPIKNIKPYFYTQKSPFSTSL